MRFFTILLMCVGALAYPVASQGVAAPGAISSIVFGPGEGGKESITMTLTGADAPVVFTIKGDNPRLVLDFANATYHGKAKIAVDKSLFVKSIRSAVHHQPSLRTRVVVDLVANQEVRHREKFQAETGTLTVTLEAINQVEGAAKPPPVPDQPEPPPAKPVTLEKPVQPAPAAPPPSATPLSGGGGVVPAPADQQDPPVPTGPKQAIDRKSPPPPSPPAVAAETAPAAKPVLAAKGDKKATAPTSPMLLDVTFDGASKKGELVQLKLNGFYAPHITAIEEGTPQVICEYSGMVMEEKVPSTILAGGKFVKTIWVTSDPGKRKVRIVLDLQPNKSYDLQQVYFKEDQIFVLIVNDLARSQSPSAKP